MSLHAGFQSATVFLPADVARTEEGFSQRTLSLRAIMPFARSYWLLLAALGACCSFRHPLHRQRAGARSSSDLQELSRNTEGVRLQCIKDARIAAFESSWKATGVQASGLSHREFNYECGSVRGLGTTARKSKGETVIALPVGASLVALEGDPLSCTVPAYTECWNAGAQIA
jgi:hypothetical protein